MNCIICKNYGDCPVEREVYGRDYKFESNGLNGVECAEYKQDYITPEQYKKRTGREWPDNAAVYSRAKNTNGGWSLWSISSFWCAKLTVYEIQIVCATEAGPPPND